MGQKNARRKSAACSTPRQSLIWQTLERGTRRVYAAVASCGLGRLMSSYRKADANLHSGQRRTLRDDCRPMSASRLRLLEAVRQAKLPLWISRFFAVMAHAPANFYGLFGLFYGLLGILVYFVGPLVMKTLSLDVLRLILCIGISVVSLPLTFSGKAMVQLLVTSKLTGWFFVSFLGLPEERLSRTDASSERKRSPALPILLAFLLALACAALTLWVHPLVPLLCLLLLCTVGMIFAYPETGVMLSVICMPFVFFKEEVILVAAALILVTWLGYGVQLLYMHRTIRFGLLDIAVLIFGATLCLSGMTGAHVTAQSVLQGFLYFVLISVHFLMANLITTRQSLRRCMAGAALIIPMVIIVGAVRLLPHGALSWLTGSVAGDAINQAFEALLTEISRQWNYAGICVLLLVLPLLYSRLIRKGRLRRSVGICLCILLCLAGLYLSGSGAFWIGLCGFFAFFLLYSHRALAVGILSLPVAVCGGAWVQYAFPDSVQNTLYRLADGQAYREGIWQSAWRMICDYPAGIGLGDAAFSAVYPQYAEAGSTQAATLHSLGLELMRVGGFPLLLLFLAVVFFFLQKSFTCVKASGSRTDLATVQSGVVAMGCLLVYGAFSSNVCTLPAFFACWLALGLYNAYANVALAESDLMTVCAERDEHRADFVFRTARR